MSHTSLISIITPCLNRAGFIAEAVESVRQQDDPSVEHIVMDGGSTDGTLEVLDRYPHLRVFSQPDEGIYDALNKGIHLARGDLLGFLNTDDVYKPGVFRDVAQTFIENPEIDALVGGATIFTENSKGERVTVAIFPCIAQNELLARATQGAPIFNAWFFRRRLFEKLGVFDTRYRYVADRDFLIRMDFQASSYASLNRTIYHYLMHPGSFTLSGQDSGEAEFMFECRDLAERYIHQRGISPNTLKCFKDWHSQITADQIITAWRKRAFRRISGYILTGLRNNYFGWPRIFMGKSIERVSVFLGRESA